MTSHDLEAASLSLSQKPRSSLSVARNLEIFNGSRDYIDNGGFSPQAWLFLDDSLRALKLHGGLSLLKRPPVHLFCSGGAVFNSLWKACQHLFFLYQCEQPYSLTSQAVPRNGYLFYPVPLAHYMPSRSLCKCDPKLITSTLSLSAHRSLSQTSPRGNYTHRMFASRVTNNIKNFIPLRAFLRWADGHKKAARIRFSSWRKGRRKARNLLLFHSAGRERYQKARTARSRLHPAEAKESAFGNCLPLGKETEWTMFDWEYTHLKRFEKCTYTPTKESAFGNFCPSVQKLIEICVTEGIHSWETICKKYCETFEKTAFRVVPVFQVL